MIVILFCKGFLAAGMRGLLDKDIYEAIANLGKFLGNYAAKL
jgi:hypothetical protein